MKIKVAKYISQFCVDNGIKDCFMVTGGGAMHLNDAFGHQDGMHCTFNHHEQASSIAGEAYARYSGEISVVCVTSGPGGTNAITGVIGGWQDSIPMLVISGQVKRETTIWSCQEIGLRQLGDQEFDIVNSVSNMTKYAVMLTEPKEVAYHFEKALYLAKNGRPGPVWIDIPLDVQGAVIETEELIHFSAESENALLDETDDVINSAEKIINLVEKAERPLFLLGTGVRLSGAYELLETMVSKFNIPVVTAWNANDLIAYDNPCYVGMPGTVGMRSGNFAVQNCDLLISIGCRLNVRMIGYNWGDFAKNAYKIIVDIDPKELRKPTITPDLPIVADAKKLIEALISANYNKQSKHEKWLDSSRDLLYKYPTVRPEYFDSKDKKINPYVFIDKLFGQLEEGDVVACGNGSACVVTFQAAKIKQNQRMFTNSGCAAMGYGLPAAVGVAVKNKDRRTICIDGDGSIMMNVQELATVAYNKQNIKIFIINNNGYHSIRQTQTNMFNSQYVGIDSHTGVGFPDFEKLAEAFGIKYTQLNAENAECCLMEVLSDDEPQICEVMVDAGQNFAPKSSSKVLPDGRIVSPSIDDMAPFLDREEYQRAKFIGGKDE